MPGRLRGFTSALLAFLAWGLFPVYFKLLAQVPSLEVLAHRVVWSLALLLAASALTRRLGAARQALGPGKRPFIAASTVLIAVNWLTYIWAVQQGRVLEASVGYFVNPLVSVLLGVVFLGERLRRPQVLAVGLAGAGVLVLVAWLRVLPWLPLTLALSFGLYGLVRKRAGVDAVGGLLAETALLAPLALGLLLWRARAGTGAFGGGLSTSLLLAAAGPITAIPLIWFAQGVQRLPLSTVGLLQYVTPSMQLLLAVAAYHERFLPAHAVAFACIWSALALYSWDLVREARRFGPAAPG